MTENYLTYWHVDQPPFLRPVAATELYVPPSRAPALERLLLFCRQNQALVLVSGDAGTGKSTLLKWLFQSLPADTHEILLTAMVKKERDGGWLTPRMAALMGIQPAAAAGDLAELIRLTASRLDELIAEKRKLIVAIDAAHLAETPDALGEIVAFLNLQSLAGTCLSFVLSGDASLRATVEATPGLATRLAFNLTLPRLAQDETAAYVAHRLRLADLTVPFDSEALDLIQARTRGVFARIDAYAENCLIEACARGARRITADVARAAAQSLLGGQQGETFSPKSDDMRPQPLPTSAAPVPRGTGRPEAAQAPAVPPADFNVPPPPPAGRQETAPDAASIKLTSLFKANPKRP